MIRRRPVLMASPEAIRNATYLFHDSPATPTNLRWRRAELHAKVAKPLLVKMIKNPAGRDSYRGRLLCSS
jgi:hypothetical protein